MSRAARLLIVALLLALAPKAFAQAPSPAPDPDVVSIRSDYEFGKYEDALKRARERIDRGGLSEDQTLELHRIAGLSAFNLGKTEDAERHFGAVLRLDPDYAMDPFTVPPPAIQLFEKIRKDMGATLDAIRYERRLKAERLKREAEDQQKAQREEEEKRRKLELMASAAAARTIERRSFLVNFVPFGAGQFQQGRTGVGVALAVSEGTLAMTSIAGYWLYNSLISSRTTVLEERDEKPTITERGIPFERQDEARVYRWLQLGGGAAFYTVYAFGVVDAIYHHEATVTITPPPEAEKPRASLNFLPVPGGAGAGLTYKF
ncbi:MAG: hypothetical protein ACJ790_03940 [Myxococcaceae bacterium]